MVLLLKPAGIYPVVYTPTTPKISLFRKSQGLLPPRRAPWCCQWSVLAHLSAGLSGSSCCSILSRFSLPGYASRASCVNPNSGDISRCCSNGITFHFRTPVVIVFLPVFRQPPPRLTSSLHGTLQANPSAGGGTSLANRRTGGADEGGAC